MLSLATLGMAMACESFGDTSATERDAGDEASSPDASLTDATADVATDAPAAACIPDPPADGGAENAACEPGKPAVDLSTSRNHCGACDVDCGEGQCSAGVCQPTDVDVTAGGTVLGAVTSTHLYYASNDLDCTTSSVRRRPLVGDAGAEALFGQDGGCFYQVAIDQNRLLYLHSTTGIHATTVTDAAVSEPAIIPGNAFIGMHVAPNGIFYLDAYRAAVRLAGKDGQNPVLVYDEPTRVIHTFGGTGDSAWWTTAPIADAGPGDETLSTRAIASGSTFIRQTGLTSIRSMALDVEYIYLASTTGDVVRLRKDDTSAPERLATIDVAERYPRAMTVVGNYVYVAVGSEGTPFNGGFSLYRIKKCGGRTRKIGSGYMLGASLFAAGAYLYYGDIGQLKRFSIGEP